MNYNATDFCRMREQCRLTHHCEPCMNAPPVGFPQRDFTHQKEYFYLEMENPNSYNSFTKDLPRSDKPHSKKSKSLNKKSTKSKNMSEPDPSRYKGKSPSTTSTSRNSTNRKLPSSDSKIITNESTIRSRPSSTNRSLSKKNSSKFASSDSKITKQQSSSRSRINPFKSGEECSMMDPQSVDQLKRDLTLIKEQLLFLTKHRDEALSITNELENRYNILMKRNEEQEEEIEKLRLENKKLAETATTSSNFSDMTKAKQQLEDYESKLNELYNEFMDTSKIFKDNKNKDCKCGGGESDKEKSVRFDESKDAEIAKLMKSLQKAKQREVKYEKQNHILTETVEKLNQQLRVAINNLEQCQNQTKNAAYQMQKELKENAKSYTYEMEMKNREIVALRSTIEDLRVKVCECNANNENSTYLGAQYYQLLGQYNQVLKKLQMYEENEKSRGQEIEVLRKNEKELLDELVKSQEFANQLSKTSNDSSITIAELTTTVQEKDSLINLQKTELVAKDKQIELLLKNEQRLKQRTVQLQEELVSMRVNAKAKSPENNLVYNSEDCSIHLTEELQNLINALYDEIDKTLLKDEHIQKQNENICCLQCNLSSKDNELNYVKNELQMLRQRYSVTLKEKLALSDNLKKLTRSKYYGPLEMEEERLSLECYCET